MMQLDKKIQKILKNLKRFNDVRIIGLIVFGGIVLLVAWSGLEVVQKNYELEKRVAELKAENEVNKLENANLELKTKYFETDHYLELTARRQFSKAAPGEQLYLVPKDVAMSKTVDLPKTKAEIEAATAKPKPKYMQNLEAWLDFFFSRGG